MGCVPNPVVPSAVNVKRQGATIGAAPTAKPLQRAEKNAALRALVPAAVARSRAVAPAVRATGVGAAALAAAKAAAAGKNTPAQAQSSAGGDAMAQFYDAMAQI